MVVYPLWGSSQICVNVFFCLVLWLHEDVPSVVFSGQWNNVHNHNDDQRNHRKVDVKNKKLFQGDLRKFRSDCSQRVILHLSQVSEDGLRIFIPAGWILNDVHWVQDWCLFGRHQHSDKVNWLNDLNSLETNHFVDIRPNVKLEQKKEDQHSWNNVDVLVSWKQGLFFKNQRSVDSNEFTVKCKRRRLRNNEIWIKSEGCLKIWCLQLFFVRHCDKKFSSFWGVCEL